jgi:hypothetical protein
VKSEKETVLKRAVLFLLKSGNKIKKERFNTSEPFLLQGELFGCKLPIAALAVDVAAIAILLSLQSAAFAAAQITVAGITIRIAVNSRTLTLQAPVFTRRKTSVSVLLIVNSVSVLLPVNVAVAIPTTIRAAAVAVNAAIPVFPIPVLSPLRVRRRDIETQTKGDCRNNQTEFSQITHILSL